MNILRRKNIFQLITFICNGRTGIRNDLFNNMYVTMWRSITQINLLNLSFSFSIMHYVIYFTEVRKTKDYFLIKCRCTVHTKIK